MKTREAMRVLAAHREGAVAVCALGMASNEWSEPRACATSTSTSARSAISTTLCM